MSLRIILKDQDITKYVLGRSLKWNRYNEFRSDFSFDMDISGNEQPFVSSGMEVRLFEDDNILWGGIINEALFIYISENLTGIRIRCGGYEQIPARRSSGVINLSATNAGAAASHIFKQYLWDGEGIGYTPDSFDNGGNIVGYVSPAARLNKIFNDLAGASGYCWWITEDKTFYFKARIPVRITDFKIDLDKNSNQKEVISLYFREKTSEYRNIQIVLGKNSIVGIARNETEISRMKSLYGSGEYASIAVNRNIETQYDADIAAANILYSYENEPLTAEFTTTGKGLKLFDRIKIRAPRYSLEDFTPFLITEIRAAYTGSRFIYTVTARKSSALFYRPGSGWTDTLGQLISRSDTGIKGSPSADTDDYLRPENILPGNNITIDRKGKNLTIHAITGGSGLDSEIKLPMAPEEYLIEMTVEL